MKFSIYFLILALFFGCSENKPEIFFKQLPQTYLLKSDFQSLPHFDDDSYEDVLESFLNNCRSKGAQKLYGALCEQAKSVKHPKSFFKDSFTPYVITNKGDKRVGLLTGYYEAELEASLTQHDAYQYPLYKTPKDLIVVDLSSIYPELKNYRLRGKLVGNRLLPYDTREESQKRAVNAEVICYCNSKIERFFLEIQGSGRVQLDNNETLYVGFANQNGHKYRSIGRYLINIGAIKPEDVSMQSIKAWLESHPQRIDEVLNYNNSMVFFEPREQGATGALGLALQAKRSVAVDRRYIPLGSMLYLHSNIDAEEFNRVVFAQDTGGAIKGAVRADLFLGTGREAMESAGKLRSDLSLWILLPKTQKKKSS